MLGHEDKLYSGHLGSKLSPSVEPVQPGHGNVQHNDVRIQFGCSVQKRPSIAHRAHNFATGLKNVLQRISQHPMVIRQQDTWATHDSSSSSACIVTCSPFVAKKNGTSATI